MGVALIVMFLVGGAFILALTMVVLLLMKEETIERLPVPELFRNGIRKMQHEYLKGTSWYKEEQEKVKRIEEAERKAIIFARSGPSS